jgi:exosome complex RNA-binding protein Rrp42 (RNase PH superfamily)
MNVETKIVSKNEKKFVRSSLANGIRVDGRRDVDCRPVRVSFIDNGNCEIQMGGTRYVREQSCFFGSFF